MVLAFSGLLHSDHYIGFVQRRSSAITTQTEICYSCDPLLTSCLSSFAEQHARLCASHQSLLRCVSPLTPMLSATMPRWIPLSSRARSPHRCASCPALTATWQHRRCFRPGCLSQEQFWQQGRVPRICHRMRCAPHRLHLWSLHGRVVHAPSLGCLQKMW